MVLNASCSFLHGFRSWKRAIAWIVGIGILAGAAASQSLAQDARRSPRAASGHYTRKTADIERDETPETKAKLNALIADMLEPESVLRVDPRRSMLIRTKQPVSRFSVTNPEILEVVQFDPMQFELIGGRAGQTTLTLWFGETGRVVLRYLVEVQHNEEIEDRQKTEYSKLQRRINELYPSSQIQLIPISDKLIVRGQARDSEEAAEILGILRGQATNQQGTLLAPGSGPGAYGAFSGSFGGGYGGIGGLASGNVVVEGTAATPSPGETDLPASTLISLMDVPGERQIMLKVRIAELTRNALRQMGVAINKGGGSFNFNEDLSINGAFNAVLSTTDLALSFQAVATNGYAKILAEPNLVTLSGYPAYFISGGEFAVPVVVGVQGAAAASANFRGYGTQLSFTPTIIDKDRIRLRVAPSFSTINHDNAVNGIPGLNSRAVVTTVDLREGQWLAIAGLIQDQQTANKTRVPFLGDVPILDMLFSNKRVNRDETELVVLVSPELVHPLEPQQRPLILPGMEVTEPDDWQFFFYGNYEGDPACQYRSTVAPLYRRDAWYAHRDAIRSVKTQSRFQQSEECYVVGPHGFSE
jgi:pilus assembly protein CpaC